MRSEYLAARFFIMLVISIFVVELIVMVSLGQALSVLSPLLVGLIDSALLTAILFPVLFFLVLRPLLTLAAERKEAELASKEAYAAVETRVTERTAELAMANKRLTTEVDIRERGKDLSDTLNRIDTAISATFDMNKIMETAITESTRKLGCPASAVLMRDDGHWEFTHVLGLPREQLGVRIPESAARAATEVSRTHHLLVSDETLSDADENKEFLREPGLSTFLTVPLIIKSEVVGVIDYYHQASPFAFSEVELDFANKLGAATAMAMESARLYSTQRSIADTLQEALLTVPEEVKGIEFGHLYSSTTLDAAKAGGDFYDVFELAHGKVGILIGDVSGKGIEAATLTSLVKNTIRAYVYLHSSPAEVISLTNAALIRAASSAFVTLFFAVLDVQTGLLTYCPAGHPPAIIKRRRAASASFLEVGAPAVGIFDEVEFFDQTATLEAGDLLLLYTDGASEARCGSDFYGEERLRQAVSSLDNIATEDVPRLIFKGLMNFCHGSLADDIAILAVALSPGNDVIP